MLSILAFQVLFAVDAASPNYAHEIAEFRAHREKEIASESGWITLVGLHWLKPGENRVGADPASEVPLPAAAPAKVGSIYLSDKNTAKFVPSPGISLKETTLRPDADVLQVGRIRFFAIQRDGKLAVRVKDGDSAARKAFTGLKWFPVDAAWRIEGKFTAFQTPRTITFETVAGVKEQMVSPGLVTFQKEGQRIQLQPVMDEGQLFFVFRDQTSGTSTYGGARFLYAEVAKNGVVVLDFNEAVNPPCVFTSFATCPLPPAAESNGHPGQSRRVNVWE